MNTVIVSKEQAEQDELFQMANLFPPRTGLPFIVWISTGLGVPDDIRVKVARGGKVKPSEMISVALRPAVHVTQGELSTKELALLTRWIELNPETLLAFWNEEIDTGDVLERLRRVEEKESNA